MANIIGSAHVNIRAITTQLETEIQAALSRIQDTITITVDADVSKAKAKIEKISKSLAETVSVDVNANTVSAEEAISRVRNSRPVNIDIRAITSKAIAKIIAISAFAKTQTAAITATIASAAAKAELAILSRPRIAPIYVNVVKTPLDNLKKTLGSVSNTIKDFGTRVSSVIGPSTKFGSALHSVSSRVSNFGRSAVKNIGAASVAMTAFTRTAISRLPAIANHISTLGNRAKNFSVLAARYTGLTTVVRGMSTAMVKSFETAGGSVGRFAARFSGGNIVLDYFKKVKNSFSNLDEMAVSVGKLGLKFGTLGAMILSASSGLITLGASLMSVINMFAIASVGIGTGFLVGLGSMIAALKDFGKVLPDVVTQFKGLQKTISSNFWAQAAAPMRDMANSVMPSLREGLGSTGAALGRWTGSLASAVKQSLSAKVLEGMFGNLTKSIDTASQANKPLVQSLTTLGQVGSALLPRLAGWFVDITNQFNNFIQKAAADGSLQKWVEDGITALKQFGSVIGSTIGIFQNLNKAAEAAGVDGLGTLAKTFDEIEAATGSASGMQAITDIMRGAKAAADGLGDGLRGIFGGLKDAAGTIGTILATLGQSLRTLGETIGNIFSNVEFQKGAEDLFFGINNAVQALAPALEALAPKIGAVMTTLGALLGVIGPVLAQAIQMVVPPLIAIHDALAPLIPILGGILLNALTAIQPLFASITVIIEQLGPPLQAIASVLGGILVQAISALMPFITALTDTLGAGLVGAAKGAEDGLSGMLIGLINGLASAYPGLITALSGIVTTLLTTILQAAPQFIQGFVGVFQSLSAALISVVPSLITAVIGLVNQVVPIIVQSAPLIFDAALQFFQGLWTAVSEIITQLLPVVVEGLTQIIPAIVGMIPTLLDSAVQLFSGLVQALTVVVPQIITALLTAIPQILDAVLGALPALLNAAIQLFMGLVNAIPQIIPPLITALVGLLPKLLTTIVNMIPAILTAAIQLFTQLIQALPIIVPKLVLAIVQLIPSIISAVISMIPALINAAVQLFTALITALPKVVPQLIQALILLGPQMVKAFADMGPQLLQAGKDIIQGLINGVGSMIDSAVNAVKNVGGAMLDGIKGFLGIKSPSREFMKVGHWVAMGLVEGVKGGQPRAIKTMANLAQRITDAASEHFKRANMVSVIRAGQRNVELQQGRLLDRAAAQVRAQVNYIGNLAKQRETLAARLKTAQANVNKALSVRNKAAEEVAKDLRGEFKLSNFVGLDAKDIVSGVSDIAARIRTFGSKITELRKLGLSAALINEVAGLGSEDGIIVADSLIAGGKSQVSALNAAFKSIDTSARGTGLAVANGMYGAGIDAMQGFVNGLRKNINAIDAAAKAVGSRLVAQVKKVLGIRSPSRVMRDEIGLQIGAGLAEGMRKSMKLVSAAADDLISAAVPSEIPSLALAQASGPIITSSTLTGRETTANQSTGTATPVSNRTDSGINVNVYPSAGMDERLVGDIAVRELNFQFLGR